MIAFEFANRRSTVRTDLDGDDVMRRTIRVRRSVVSVTVVLMWSAECQTPVRELLEQLRFQSKVEGVMRADPSKRRALTAARVRAWEVKSAKKRMDAIPMADLVGHRRAIATNTDQSRSVRAAWDRRGYHQTKLAGAVCPRLFLPQLSLGRSFSPISITACLPIIF